MLAKMWAPSLLVFQPGASVFTISMSKLQSCRCFWLFKTCSGYFLRRIAIGCSHMPLLCDLFKIVCLVTNILDQGFPTFYQPHTSKRAKKMFAYHQIFLGEMKLMKQTQKVCFGSFDIINLSYYWIMIFSINSITFREHSYKLGNKLHFKLLETFLAYHLRPVLVPPVVLVPQVGNPCLRWKIAFNYNI
jgi:hypothetical protein